jgi:hypothetical protein
MATATRPIVLSLYRRILRIGQNWESETERQYIKEEARRLFKMNKNINAPNEIQEHIAEAEQRLELAVHYQNPYPRFFNSNKFVKVKDIKNGPNPSYMKSYFK